MCAYVCVCVRVCVIFVRAISSRFCNLRQIARYGHHGKGRQRWTKGTGRRTTSVRDRGCTGIINAAGVGATAAGAAAAAATVQSIATGDCCVTARSAATVNCVGTVVTIASGGGAAAAITTKYL